MRREKWKIVNFFKKECRDCSNGKDFLKNIPPGTARGRTIQGQIFERKM